MCGCALCVCVSQCAVPMRKLTVTNENKWLKIKIRRALQLPLRNSYEAFGSIRNICLKIVKLVEQFLSCTTQQYFSLSSARWLEMEISKSFCFCFANSFFVVELESMRGRSVTQVLTYQGYSWRWHLFVCNECFVCGRNRGRCRYCCVLLYR